ncbi:MAG: hypothetical protein GY892_17990, partial [Shimia sp.]|nr:hypothetical protein [Shimia sp.]
GVLLGQAAGGLIFAGVSWVMVNRVFGKLPKPDDVDRHHPNLSGSIDGSFGSRVKNR